MFVLIHHHNLIIYMRFYILNRYISVTQVILFGLFISLSPQASAQSGCNCSEYVYLNEPHSGGAVLKYKVEANGDLTPISPPWFDNGAAGEDLTVPHGLGIDPNGFIYVGEIASGGQIRRFTCDGGILPESEFAITNGGQTSIASLDGFLYANDWNSRFIKKHDYCTQGLVAEVELCNAGGQNWGLYYDENTGLFYATAGHGTNGTGYLYTFTDADFDNDPNTCVMPVPLAVPLPSNNSRIGGVVTDPAGNIFIAVRIDNSMNPSGSYLLKYGPAPNYTFMGSSIIDTGDDGTGFYQPLGLVYSQTSGLIYVSNRGVVDDCVSSFDTDLNYVGTAVPAAGNGTAAKGIGITTECCPVSSNVVIDTLICMNSVGDNILLADLLDCQEGTICEGVWSELAGNVGITFDDCDFFLTITSPDACGTFVRESDGTAPASQCGAFTITVNVQTADLPTVSVSADQNYTCPIPSTFAPISVTTTADNIQWQVSTTSCTAGFSDISGATSAAYTPIGLTSTTYYRAVVSNMGACDTGSCDTIGDCITVSVEEDCCPDPNCFDITVTRN